MITVPPVVTVAAGALTWLMGVLIVKRVGILSRYNLPAPVVGGFLVAVIFTVLHHYNIDRVKFDDHLVPALMLGFFTSLGFGASIQELRRGGRAVLIFLGVCSVILVAQVCIGAFIATLLGKHPLFGVLTSAVSLVGGPGTALTFAPEFENLGVKNAATAGLAAAMLGIIFGGVLGAPLSTILVGRTKGGDGVAKKTRRPITTENESMPISEICSTLIYNNAWLLIMGATGYYLSLGIKEAGIRLPFYIGGMIVASIVRNIDDVTGIFGLKREWIDAIGSACLTLFISVSMMTLQLWAIADVAGPLLANLVVQTLLVVIVAATIMYRVMGKDYDAAVISGGMVGFMLGTTANALATMTSVTARFGPAPRAFLVVPLVGACFIDFVNAIVISICLNVFA